MLWLFLELIVVPFEELDVLLEGQSSENGEGLSYSGLGNVCERRSKSY